MFGLNMGRLGLTGGNKSLQKLLWPTGTEAGLWIDPSTTTASFQDSAGTTALSAIGTVLDSANPVGLILDRKRGGAKVQKPFAGWVKTAGDGVVTISGNLITITGATTATYVSPAVRTMVAGLTGIRCTYTDISSAVSPLVYVAGLPVAPTSGVSVLIQKPSTNSPLERVQISSGTASFLIEEYYEIPGLHLSQATSAARPVASGRVNLLTATEDFANAAWVVSGAASKEASTTICPDGSTTAYRFVCPSTIADLIRQTVTVVAGDHSAAIYIRSRTGVSQVVKVSVAGNDVVTATTDWTRVSSTENLGAGSRAYTIGYSSGPVDVDVWHPSMNIGLTLQDYQPVVSASSYTATGFPVYDKFDGTDDGWASATVAAGVVGNSDMTCLIAVRRDSAANCVAGLYNAVADATKYFGMAESASGSACVGTGAGTPTVWVDNVQLTGGTAVTRGTLHTALTAGAWHILEFRGLDLSTWTAAGFGLYTSYVLNGALGGKGVELFPTTTAANLNRARTELAASVGLVL